MLIYYTMHYTILKNIGLIQYNTNTLQYLQKWYTILRGAKSVKLPRSKKIPTNAAPVPLPIISFCFLTKPVLWSLLHNCFAHSQWWKQVFFYINQVFISFCTPLKPKLYFVSHLSLSIIPIFHFWYLFLIICRNWCTWWLSCRIALLPW